MKQCKCEHWQQCPVCMPHRFDANGNLLPPEPTPLQVCQAECNEQARLLGMSAERELRLRAINAQLLEALELAEAGLSDIGDADREPGDDLAWCERRAAGPLPVIRAAIAAAKEQA